MGDITLAARPGMLISIARTHSEVIFHRSTVKSEGIVSLDKIISRLRDGPELLNKIFRNGYNWSAPEVCKAIATTFLELKAEGVELVRWPDTKDGPETATLAQHPIVHAVKIQWGGVTSVVSVKEGPENSFVFKVGIPTEYQTKIGETGFEVQSDLAIVLAAGEVVKALKQI